MRYGMARAASERLFCRRSGAIKALQQWYSVTASSLPPRAGVIRRAPVVMFAPRQIPPEYLAWNRQHGAPFGHFAAFKPVLRRVLPLELRTRLMGPFSIQPNNTIREFEYPWAFHAVPLGPGVRVLDVGGGLGGFDFTLSKLGCDVVNVDPGMEAKGKGWPCDVATINKLNGIFGSRVELRNTTVQRANLEPNAYDVAYSISVIEHLPQQEIAEVCAAVFACLKPGGKLVMTVDLFLDTTPFTAQARNKYGVNVDLKWLTEVAPFELVVGERSQLFGFPEFDVKRVRENLDGYLVGAYPVLAQCIVLRKPLTA